jgi:hypothetical protein
MLAGEGSLLGRAREWLNTGAGRWIAVATALVLLAGALAVFLRDPAKGRTHAVLSKGRTYLFYCRACQQTGELHLPYDAKFPQTCPKCGKKEAYLGFRCVGCRNIIEKQDAPVFTCPHPQCRYVYDQRIKPP